jgi:hypothetical protein
MAAGGTTAGMAGGTMAGMAVGGTTAGTAAGRATAGMAVGGTTVGAAEAPQAGQIPVSSSRKIARAQACARGTSVSMRRNSFRRNLGPAGGAAWSFGNRGESDLTRVDIIFGISKEKREVWPISAFNFIVAGPYDIQSPRCHEQLEPVPDKASQIGA